MVGPDRGAAPVRRSNERTKMKPHVSYIRAEIAAGHALGLIERTLALFPGVTHNAVRTLVRRSSAATVSESPAPVSLEAPVAKPAKAARPAYAVEVKLVTLRETPSTPDALTIDTPDKAAAYWREQIATAPWFNADVESFAVIHLNTRRRAISHRLVSTGTLDTILVHPREVFRAAIVDNAAAVILMHNHPSGDPTPSEADIKVTRDLIRGGQLLKIEVLDHVVVGEGKRSSLRELGYFYQA